MYQKIVTTIRLLMGIEYLINGINWWFKLITPYPSLSDFVTNPPPPDVVGAMIQTGSMFHLIKAAEILTGIALLTNRFVPLMLVVIFPVTVSVFIVDVFMVAHLRGYTMGIGALFMNSFLMCAYLRYYKTMLNSNTSPDPLIHTLNKHNDKTVITEKWLTAWETSTLRAQIMPVFAGVTLLFGVTIVCWVAIMMVQYMLNPAPMFG